MDTNWIHMAYNNYNDMFRSMGWDIAYNPDKMAHTLTTSSGGTYASYQITDEMLTSSKTIEAMKQELAKLRADVQERDKRTATQAMIEQQQYMQRREMEARYPMRAYSDAADALLYSQRALATKPQDIAVLDSHQFSKEAAAQFAAQNPHMQVMVAPDPDKAVRLYPASYGVKTFGAGVAGVNIRAGDLVTTRNLQAVKKPLASARPDAKRWKYSSLWP